jgi:hypothetical protein
MRNRELLLRALASHSILNFSSIESKMGSLVSLPLLSFLALPFYSSPATSFNLLLFTANWYILLLTHPPIQVELYGILFVRLLFYVLPSLLFLLFDSLLPTVTAQIKAQGDLGLPGRQSSKKQALIVFWSLANVALGLVCHVGVEEALTRGLRLRSALSLSKRLPLPYDMVKAIAMLLVIRGVRHSDILTQSYQRSFD